MEIRDSEKCEKCNGAMVKIGVMDSGNSKFEKLSCKACGHTTMKAIGLNQ